MPKIGMGTDKLFESDIIYRAAAEIGYRMFDCASMYKNEEVVGEAITKLFDEKKVERKDLFIVSKVNPSEVEDCEAACRRSIAKLKVEYLDLYLVHWPLATRIVK